VVIPDHQSERPFEMVFGADKLGAVNRSRGDGVLDDLELRLRSAKLLAQFRDLIHGQTGALSHDGKFGPRELLLKLCYRGRFLFLFHLSSLSFAVVADRSVPK